MQLPNVQVNESYHPALGTLFAQNLLVARLARECTQQVLALQSNVSRATIAQLEAGTGDPKLSTVQQLAEALGVSPVLLLLGRPELVALSAFRGDEEDSKTQSPQMTTMKHLAGLGVLRSRLEAAQIGISVAKKAGIESAGGAIGAAIGSFHLPGRGTLAAAQLANHFDGDILE